MIPPLPINRTKEQLPSYPLLSRCQVPRPQHSPSWHMPMPPTEITYASAWVEVQEGQGINAIPGWALWEALWDWSECAWCLLRSSLGIDTHGQRKRKYGWAEGEVKAWCRPIQPEPQPTLWGALEPNLGCPKLSLNGQAFTLPFQPVMGCAPPWKGVTLARCSLKLRQLLNALIIKVVHWKHPRIWATGPSLKENLGSMLWWPL